MGLTYGGGIEKRVLSLFAPDRLRARIFGAITMPINSSVAAAAAAHNYSSLARSPHTPNEGEGGSQGRPKRFVTLMDLCRPRRRSRSMLLAAYLSFCPSCPPLFPSFFRPSFISFLPSQFFHFPLFD